MSRRLSLYAAGFSLAILAASEVFSLLVLGEAAPAEYPWTEADERAGWNPKPCLSYNPQTDTFGRANDSCPANHAIFGHANFKPKSGDAPTWSVPLTAYCCPLPADDILLGELEGEFADSCPEDAVITGTRGDPQRMASYMLRCTRINTEKYRLGPSEPPYFWKKRWLTDASGGGAGSRRIVFDSIPLAIRFGIGRDYGDMWSGDGCVGFPYGSLLAARGSGSCSSSRYRQLLTKADNKPVPMFPHCRRLSGLFDPSPRCIR